MKIMIVINDNDNERKWWCEMINDNININDNE